jgi:hypothetical protein
MNVELLKTILRQLLIALGTYLVTNGHIDQSLVEPIVGGFLAIFAAVWGLYTKKSDQKKIKSAK